MPELVAVELDLVATFLEDGLEVGAVSGLLLFFVPMEDVGTTLLTEEGGGDFWLATVLAGEDVGLGVTNGGGAVADGGGEQGASAMKKMKEKG